MLRAALLLICVCLSGPAAAAVQPCPSTVKLRDSGPLPEACGPDLVLDGLRGEWVGFQLAIDAPADRPLSGVTLTGLRLADGAGQTVPGTRFEPYREIYLDIENESPGTQQLHERLPGRYPDPLVPFGGMKDGREVAAGAPFDLAAGGRAVAFVDLRLPDTVAGGGGRFAIDCEVTAAEGTFASLSVPIEIIDAALPPERSVATAFGGLSAGALRAFHGGPRAEPAAGFDQTVKAYLQVVHDHRIDPTTVDGPLEFSFAPDGSLLPVDFSAYDAAVAPLLDGTLFDDGRGVVRFNVGRFRPGSGTGSLSEDQYRQAAAAFAGHLEAMGWWERAYIYASDEPWLNGGREKYEAIRNDALRLADASPLWQRKTLVTSPYSELVSDVVGIWCPVTPMYDDWFYTGEGAMAGRETYPGLIGQGQQLWFYVCNANFPPYAGYDIDSWIGHEPRIVKWGAWYEGATGFLYWRMTYWVDSDPWNVWLNLPEFGETFARNGDGILLYPGDHDGTAGGTGSPVWLAIDGPVVSFRLKQIRDGLEDWELFRLAEELGGGAYARQQVARAYSRFGDFFWESCESEQYYCPDDQPWTLDEGLLREVRRNVALKVRHLLQPDRYPDPEAAPADGDMPDGDRDGGEGETEPAGGSDGCGGRPGSALLLLLLLTGLARRAFSACVAPGRH